MGFKISAGGKCEDVGVCDGYTNVQGAKRLMAVTVNLVSLAMRQRSIRSDVSSQRHGGTRFPPGVAISVWTWGVFGSGPAPRPGRPNAEMKQREDL